MMENIEVKIRQELDHLTMEQTEKLLDIDMKLKISDHTRHRIQKSVFQKIGTNQKHGIHFPKKLVACAASFVILFTGVSIVGFDTVSAAIKNLFTFIPGVGITETASDTIYAMNPIETQLQSDNQTARIVRATYANGYLNMIAEVTSNHIEYATSVKTDSTDPLLFYDDFSFYVNGVQKDYQDDVSTASLALSLNSAMLDISYKSEPPQDNDIYEIGITGFSQKLSFKLTACSSFDDIKEIGPTVIQNGISLTATAERLDNLLLVWCYPFKVTNKTNDRILGLGQPGNGSFIQTRFIKTENGRLSECFPGISLTERMLFEMPENVQTATLHIPYLSMLREEKDKLKINLPNDYSTITSEAASENSLGTVTVSKVTRAKNEHTSDKDTVKIYFEFESNNDTMRLCSFAFDADPYPSSVRAFNAETGCLDYLLLEVDKNETKVVFDITDLTYYLYGEYVIPLDIK
ncbi:MAG: hypothetical protein LBM69_02380 [Lachnospiraceae bacterium]|jgi:hypothetical protein|nr:hypothetical protein [Lachnospiraceae bacterium]